jgi:alkylation response protein AidB-like acyl-CoA dehydrogenase
MSPLSAGRANLALCPLVSTSNALAIALRYISHRRQFSDPKSKAK